jgi:hypothetical protein
VAGLQSWLWPLVIDRTIVLATLGIVALAPYWNQFWNRLSCGECSPRWRW